MNEVIKLPKKARISNFINNLVFNFLKVVHFLDNLLM